MGKTIESLGASDKVRKMFLSGNSLQNIADVISSEFGIVSRKEVEGFVKRESKNLQKMEKAKGNYSEKVLDTYRDAVLQFKELNNEAWKIFYEIKKTPETCVKQIVCHKCGAKNSVEINSYNSLIKSCDHLLAQITLSNKILKNLGSSKGVQVDIVNFTQKIGVVMPRLLFSKINDLQRRGIVKILSKKRFREIYPIEENEEPEEDDNQMEMGENEEGNSGEI